MAKQEFQSVKDAIAREGQSWHASPTFLSNLPEDEEGMKYLGYTPGGDELSLEARERNGVELYRHYLRILKTIKMSRKMKSPEKTPPAGNAASKQKMMQQFVVAQIGRRCNGL